MIIERVYHMVDFDRLNRETQAWRNEFVTREPSRATDPYRYGSSAYWLNRKNNETYKYNNGQYSNYYSNK